MIRPAHVYLLIPLAIALIDGHPTMSIMGWSLAAFIGIVSANKPRTPSSRFYHLMVIGDLVALLTGLGCYFYAMRLAVGP